MQRVYPLLPSGNCSGYYGFLNKSGDVQYKKYNPENNPVRWYKLYLKLLFLLQKNHSMAKVISSFQIKGTLDDLNFVVTADGTNYVRMKGKTGVSSEEFSKNPVFDRIRKQSSEFGYCVKKSKIFRQLAGRFNDLAKDGSFAGRVNKLLLEIIQEDTLNPCGERILKHALTTTDGKELLLSFESNKLRPLHQVLKTTYDCNPATQTLSLPNFKPVEDLDWPEEATHVQLTLLTTNWDFENDGFESCYSEERILEKDSGQQTLTLSTNQPIKNQLHLTFLFIGFSKQQRKKHISLARKYNTATLIAYRTF